MYRLVTFDSGILFELLNELHAHVCHCIYVLERVRVSEHACVCACIFEISYWLITCHLFSLID